MSMTQRPPTRFPGQCAAAAAKQGQAPDLSNIVPDCRTCLPLGDCPAQTRAVILRDGKRARPGSRDAGAHLVFDRGLLARGSRFLDHGLLRGRLFSAASLAKRSAFKRATLSSSACWVLDCSLHQASIALLCLGEFVLGLASSFLIGRAVPAHRHHPPDQYTAAGITENSAPPPPNWRSRQ